MYYLDCAASTPLHPAALKALAASSEQHFANPSAGHPQGEASARRIEQIRRDILRGLAAPEDGVWLFTSGATESNNTVVKGLPLEEGDEIFFNETDHPSLVAPVQEWRQKGIKTIQKNPGPKTRLAALSFVHPLTGGSLPVQELARQVKEQNPRAIVHVDAAQGFGKLPLEIGAIDSLAISAHKFGGPKGIGGLYLSPTLARTLRPLLSGGGQQGGLRSSTLPTPLIASLGEASRLALENLQENLAAARTARRQLRELLSETIPELHFPFEDLNGSPYIFSFVHPQVPAQVLLRLLAEEGIMASAGPACSSRKKGPTVPQVPPEKRQHILRISFYPSLPQKAQEALAGALKRAHDEYSPLYA